MNTTTWQAPVFFELEEVKSVDGEEVQVDLLYTPPVVLPEEVPLETNEQLLAHEPEPTPAQEVAAEPAWVNERIELPETNEQDSKTNTPIWLWLTASLAALLVGMLVVDTWAFLAEQFASSYLLGTLFTLLVLSVVSAAGVLSWRSWQKLKRFRAISGLQREGEQLLQRDGYGQARSYVNRVAEIYAQRPDVKRRLDTFQRTVNDSYHDREVCALFSQQVMQELDQKAYRLVLQRSRETALMVMVSPIALLDMVLTLWRNVRMIRDIATLYGARPDFIGSTGLIVSVVQNLIYADVSEVVADSLAETLGNSMLAVFSAQAAQGIGSGILTARVGLKAMQACRPLPFAEEERPRLKEIRRELVGSLKRIFESRKEKAQA